MKREEETMPRRRYSYISLTRPSIEGATRPCAHEHGAEIFLTPRCHPGAGVRVEVLDDSQGLPCAAVLGLRCWKCLTPVVHVALMTRVDVTLCVGMAGRWTCCIAEGTDGELPTLPRGVGDADGGAPVPA